MKTRLIIVAVTVLAAAVGGGLYLHFRTPPAPDGGIAVAEGIRLEEKSQFDAACEQYESALAADPNNREARLRLANARFKQAKWEVAVPIMMQAAKENPQDGELLINLGTALLQLDRNDEGVDVLVRATQVLPDSSAAHNNLGVALAKIGRFEDAAVEFQRTLDIDPNHRTAGRSLQLVKQQVPAKLR